ncbi:ATP-binding protein [Methylobacterium sp. V23]|uniref:ATP-binding protein n=1 Tax=Methylobacterium sp. V23 TaxID=2044878 RepID=UPI002477E342|nr:ATP-binding protein [Methylobacterium sp. V23]
MGLGPEFRAILSDVSCDLPLCGIVARTRRPFVLGHIQASAEPRHTMARGAGLTAFAGYPLLNHGRLSGVISFASTTLSEFEGESLAFFATIAHFLSTARARLEDEAVLRASENSLEGQVFERTRELMQAEEALRQSQKMEAVGQLTGGVAHDFNNLLTIIKSSTELLGKPNLPEERRARYVGAISDTVDRASKLTGQLLAFARRQSLTPEIFDVNDRVHRVTDMLGTIVGGRIRIERQMHHEPCHVEADVSQFETALVNLAVNARDAMEGEGVLALSVHCGAPMPQIRGHGYSAAQFVAVSMRDTGSGIPRDKLSSIFEPFFTTKEVGKGTGLGLSQVFGFAKQSGGNIEVESEVGTGTTFTLYLPQVEGDADGEADRQQDKRAEFPEGGGGRRVLLVEDNIEVGAFATQLLQDLGYETIWAASAHEALELLAGDRQAFDVVFSDVVMPGMNGVELAREIRRLHHGTPVILTSGYSHVLAEDGRHGFELLRKPYSVNDLSRVLRKATHH